MELTEYLIRNGYIIIGIILLALLFIVYPLFNYLGHRKIKILRRTKDVFKLNKRKIIILITSFIFYILLIIREYYYRIWSCQSVMGGPADCAYWSFLEYISHSLNNDFEVGLWFLIILGMSYGLLVLVDFIYYQKNRKNNE